MEFLCPPDLWRLESDSWAQPPWRWHLLPRVSSPATCCTWDERFSWTAWMKHDKTAKFCGKTTDIYWSLYRKANIPTRCPWALGALPGRQGRVVVAEDIARQIDLPGGQVHNVSLQRDHWPHPRLFKFVSAIGQVQKLTCLTILNLK